MRTFWNLGKSVHHGSLDFIQFSTEVTQHPGLDNVYVRLVEMGLPHVFVNVFCEDIGGCIL